MPRTDPLDFVLRAFWALRPCDPRTDVLEVRNTARSFGEIQLAMLRNTEIDPWLVC